jgi:aryl-alcohol dehydrogenase-like predicted oxidoreductase
LSGFALERGYTLLELAMSWLACQGTVVSVIAGATGPGQVEANAAAINWQLSPEEMSEVDRITRR